MNPNHGPENCKEAMSVAEKHFKIPMVLGTIWNKMSKITFFGHKHFQLRIIAKFDIFHERKKLMPFKIVVYFKLNF